MRGTCIGEDIQCPTLPACKQGHVGRGPCSCILSQILREVAMLQESQLVEENNHPTKLTPGSPDWSTFELDDL